MNKRNIIIGAVVCLLVGLVAGYLLFHGSKPISAGAVSSSGATFGTQKQAVAEIALGTSSLVALQNTDANDRVIDQTMCFIEGPVGTNYATILITAATSSVAGNVLQGGSTSTALLANDNFATTSWTTGSIGNNGYGWFIHQLATTTALSAGNTPASSTMVWAAGSFVNFIANQPVGTSTAITGGTCGVQYWSL